MTADFGFGWEIFEIIWINILLSGDNAILIALACRQLPARQQRWGVFLGALGGVVLRVIFTLLVVRLIEIPYLKAVGAALLLLVAIKLLIDETDHSAVHAKPNLWGAVMSIIMADAIMSLDNVLAIAAAAKGSTKLVVFGLALSVPIVMFGAGALLTILEKLPILVWAGAAILGWVAGEMAAGDPVLEGATAYFLDHQHLEHALAITGALVVLLIAAIVEGLNWWRERGGDE
ncbi:MAG: YjbE family putative metal transport protein [Methylocystis sp.]|nr:YjbE family putative metal transport protein [Methylocystis sp.]